MKGDDLIRQEVYECWMPAPIGGNVDIYDFSVDVDDILTLDFEVIGTQKRIRMVFRRHIAFRYTNESYRMKTLAMAQVKDVCMVYRVEKSIFLEWFLSDNYRIHEDWDIVHYCIITRNFVFDVLAFEDPEIEGNEIN